MKILIYGSDTFGRVLRHLVADCGHDFAGFIDDMRQGGDVVGAFDTVVASHPPARFACVNAVGYSDLRARRRIAERVQSAGYDMPSLVHPRAYVGRNTRVGPGSVVMAGALLDVDVTLGAQVVVWPGAAVSHECTIGSNTFLSPHSTICGCSTVGADCFVGAGAVIVDHVAVPDGTRIKAAATVTQPRSTRP
jgi:sugar O-acyltransferase (sialic acid O-acetyltransferase NeuD family)